MLCYAAAIVVMMWRAAVRVTDAGDLRGWAALGGAALFGFSDAIIAVNRFVSPFAGASVAIMVTYWLAQSLITASLPARQD